jgi:single-strand DNA-binding protein
MPNYSNATIVGHLGRDAETKSVGDRTVINFTVAVSRKVKEVEATTWWRVAYWTKSANVAQYLTKGTPVLVSGEPYLRDYDAKDGTKKQSLELDAREVKLLGGKQESQAAPAAAPAPKKPAAPAADDLGEAPF